MAMKKKELVYYTGDGAVTVRIMVNRGDLSPSEATSACERLAGKIMLAMHETTYIHAPLCKIKVSSPRG